jgi:hypothetical protein
MTANSKVVLEAWLSANHCGDMVMPRRLASFGRLMFLVTALSLLRAPFAHAQNAPAPSAWGLFSARYDTHTSDFIYALYGYGSAFAMIGTLQNTRSGWTELVGAVGRTFAFGGQPSHSIAAGVAHATEGWYAQLYYVPTVRLGPTSLRATAEWDVPIAGDGATQFAVSPVSLTLPMRRAIEAGLSMDLASAQHARTSVALGPEVRVTLPRAVVGADLQRMTDGSAGRLRLFFLTQF